MQQTSGNTQTLEPKMLFWSSNSRGGNSNKNMRKDPGRWRRFGRWREREREEKIPPAQNESMEIGGLALSLPPNTSARWQSGKETAPAIRTQDGGKSHSPASSRDLNRDLKTRDLCFRSLTICVKSACPHLGLWAQILELLISYRHTPYTNLYSYSYLYLYNWIVVTAIFAHWFCQLPKVGMSKKNALLKQ